MASTKQDAALLGLETGLNISSVIKGAVLKSERCQFSLNAKHVFCVVVHEVKQYCYHHCAWSKSLLLRLLQGDSTCRSL